MRVFAALDVSAEVRQAVGALVQELQTRVRGARWIPAANLHLTLRFLGETDAKRVSEISEKLESITAQSPPFRLEFRGVGFFPSPRRPRILCAIVARPPRELLHLHQQTEAMAVAHGFPSEPRTFSPHLTFARLQKPAGELRKIETELEDRHLGVIPVEEVILFQSMLDANGAQYQVLGRFPLGGAG